MRYRYILLGILIILFAAWASVRPSNDRDWIVEQRVLSYGGLEGDNARLYNIRNFSYRSTSDFDISYYNRTYDLNKLETVDYIVEPFSTFQGLAHTFLSFGFSDGDYVSISIEIRKEQGEEFSAVKGLARQYEVMYVIGDERDLVKLRSNHRDDPVFIYPLNLHKKVVRELFVSMVRRANALRQQPEFYNTLTSSCSLNIFQHINSVSERKVPLSIKLIFPGYSDKHVYDLGFIDTDKDFDEARAYFQINERAELFADDPDFSEKVRTPV